MKLVVVLIMGYAATSMGEDPPNPSDFGPDILEDYFNIYTQKPLPNREVKEIKDSSDAVKFYLFSNNNTNYTIIGPTNSSVVSKDSPILFLIHGWTENRTVSWYQLYTDIFFDIDSRYNIIQVDYSKYADLDYVSASSYVPVVGDIVANLIVTLMQNYSISIDNILILGHSLGGQVASFVGRNVQNSTSVKLPRILAADPAGPLFEGKPENERLNPNDATVVEVVHSNGGVFGYKGSCGTIDFFLNGGTIQPGCLVEIITNLTQITSTLGCAHYRSYEVLASAIQHRDHFESRECKSWLTYEVIADECPENFVFLGDVETNKTGNFYLKTTSAEPYYAD